MQLWKGSEYFKIPGMPGFCVCQVSSVAQDSEYAGIWLNNALWQGS